MQNFHLTVQKKDSAIQEYVSLLKLTKTEYQKLFEENKILKKKNKTVEMERQVKKRKDNKKRQYNVETDSEEEESDTQEKKEGV